MRPTTALTVAILGSSTASASFLNSNSEDKTSTYVQPNKASSVPGSASLPSPMVVRNGAPPPARDSNTDPTESTEMDVDGEEQNENTQHHGHGGGGHGHGGSHGSSASGGGAAVAAGGGSGTGGRKSGDGARLRPDIGMVGAAGGVVMGLGVLLS
ncbi:hypothetical protein QBC45DRAFT_435083 [Copromyces sp. CBS 386.78]|nr:hypothetical protein QBC45DRAFT_435083 [Copromyces sp. CBS 386.78]